jgi:hypothetical protein
MPPQLSNVPLWFERQLAKLPPALQPRLWQQPSSSHLSSSHLSFADTLARAHQRQLTPSRSLAAPTLLTPRHPQPSRPSLVDPRQKPYQSPTAQRPGAASASTAPKPPAVARPTAPASSPAAPADPTPRPPADVDNAVPLGPFAPQATSGRDDAAKSPPSTPQTPWLALDQYPHPRGDNGRGLHWVPTTSQTPAVVDRFVSEAQRMGVKWVTFLNKGANLGDNDYLVKKLVGAGIEPIMRIYARGLDPVDGDVTSMVRHYVDLGVHYFQAYNEPNLAYEQPGGPPSVDRYLDAWLPVARQIVAGGGLPGFGAMAPGGDLDDVKFLQDALDGLRRRGELGMLDRGWLSMHNYTWNEPIDQDGIQNPNGFAKFKTYERIVRQALGRDLPIIGTEGGTYAGDHQDGGRPAVGDAQAVDMVRQAYRYMRDRREPWNFVYSYWVIANGAAGGSDASFGGQALFREDGTTSPIVSTLQSMAQGLA